MIVERVIARVKARWEHFREESGAIVLERVPSELRKAIWKSEEGNLRDTIHIVNTQLINLGKKPLDSLEYKEALDGWDVVHGK